MLRVGVTFTEEQKESIRRMAQENVEASSVRFPARRVWRIEGMAIDAEENAYPVGAQYSMLESDCATYAEAGSDPDDMIKEAALNILNKVLDRNHWTMLTWAWFNNAL